MVNKFFLLLLVVALGGCAKLAHLDELLTLQELSIDQDQQAKFMEQQEAGFQRILKVAERNNFEQFPTREEFQKNFGPPVLARPVSRGETIWEQWLYCRPTEVLNSNRVYVYFDAEGKLQDWQFVEAPPGNSEIRP